MEKQFNVDAEQIQELHDKLMELFYGIYDGVTKVSFKNIHRAMKPDLCELFEDVAGEFIFKVRGGGAKDVTKDELTTLKEELGSFGEEFSIAEVQDILPLIEKLIEG